MTEETTKPVINRVLLKYGAMFDTLLTEEQFREIMNGGAEEGFLIEIPGVFGEKLIVAWNDMLGFISRKDLDVEKAMEAANAVRQAAGQGMGQGPRIAVPGGRY